MLQIIGWLGCLYLAIKGLEIGNSRNFQNADGRVTGAGASIAVLSVLGALVFAVALLLQGDIPAQTAEHSAGQMTQGKMDCINSAKTPDEILACE